MTKSDQHEANVLVVNYTAPELNHLASGLAERGLLGRFIRPYANRHRLWERTSERFPGLRHFYIKTLGRRVLPPGLDDAKIHETAVLQDFVYAFAHKFGTSFTDALAKKLHWNIQQQIANKACKYACTARMVIGSYQVSYKAFLATSAPKVLNYPIAHHNYVRAFCAEESEREPSFASLLPDFESEPSWKNPQLDIECALADKILVGSAFARNSFISEGFPESKIIVVPYGADLTRFGASLSRRSDPNKFSVLFVGSIEQRKGLSYLLRAYETFAGRGTSLTLVGSAPRDYRALLPWEDLFTYVPHVSQQLLPLYYNRADVFIFPSLIEGMGLVVLEAMASGLPIITTPNGPGDIVRDGVDGFVVQIRDVAALVEKLEFLRVNPERRRLMGENARQRALEFSWDAYKQRVVDSLNLNN
ncbi:MAG: glycosyltransferase family 4 protein [Sulfobacillus sp.]